MNLRRLRYFVAVAEELNFSRAAKRLHIAQPPLSTQIKEFEKDLGVQLFNRTRHHVELTEAGRWLLKDSHRIFAQIEWTADMVHRIGHGRVGQLTVGFMPSVCGSILPPILRTFRERFPEVKLFLREVNPGELISMLHDKRIDVGFIYLLSEDSVLSFRPVFHEPFVVALPDNHPLATEPHIMMQALVGEPFLLNPRYPGAGLHTRIIDLCREAGFVPTIVQESWLMQTTISLVASGIGVTLVPASLQNFQRTGVIFKPIEGCSPEVELDVAWRRDTMSPVLREFLDVVREVGEHYQETVLPRL